jgi:putative acetyltransferase
MHSVRKASGPADVAAARELFTEYERWVDEPRCFAAFDEELAALPDGYEVLLLLQDSAGCAALRRLEASTAELKRLYVRPAYRGRGWGRALAEAAISTARARGYQRLVLDSLPKMSAAQALYRELGFRETPPYLPAPTPGAICFELSL